MANFTASGSNNSAVEANGSNNAPGVHATSDSGTGVYAQSTNGYAIDAHAINTAAIHGISTGAGHSAVFAEGPNGYGVYTTSDSGNGIYATSAKSVAGVFEISNSTNTQPALQAKATGGTGIYATSTSDKAGLFEIKDVNNTQPALQANTIGSTGVKGISKEGIGVAGTSNSTSDVGIGVSGTSTNGTGVSGVGNTGVSGSGTTGVFGQSTTGFAGKFLGNVDIQGTLTKSSGTFKIDHPLDPTHKYLSHSFVESSEMKTIYDGVVVLNASGEAVVELPAWFEALNKDFRYQLTCIGGYAPVYIAEKVHDNRFKLAGGQPGMEVCWQVTGVRQDPYAKAHPLLVEEEKPVEERGYYRHPELYSQPKEKGVEWVRHPEQLRQLEQVIREQ